MLKRFLLKNKIVKRYSPSCSPASIYDPLILVSGDLKVWILFRELIFTAARSKAAENRSI